MKVIPVIDILNGVVVHAVRGKRNQYQPLQSQLSKSTNSIEIAKTFQTLGFTELYIADLDAITKSSINFQTLKDISDQTHLSLMVDAGISDIEKAQKLLKSGVSKLIIGTETLQNKNFVANAVEIFGSDRVVVSLDLKSDQVLSKFEVDGFSNPICLLQDFKGMGVSQVIILDLTRVGSNEGVNVDFLKKVKVVGLDVYVGGGVRDFYDLLDLKTMGVSGALVATALHSGKITIEELKKANML